MLITKFNKMIRNRMLWGTFAVAVCLSMLGFIGPSYSCRRSRTTVDRDAGVEGRLFGEPVSDRDFSLARYFELGLNERNMPDNVKGTKALRQRTWKRIAALKTARRMGIKVSDQEIGQTISRDPSFAESGAFNRQRYEAVVQNQLKVGIQTFEQYLREILTIRKLMDLLKSAVWVAPSELQERLAHLTDSISVEYAVVKRDDKTDRVDVSRADAEAYFKAHEKSFEIPERVSVKYVAFPITNYFDPNEVSDTDVTEYYDTHTEEFAATNAGSTNAETATLPLDEVKDTIRTLLARKEAVFKARDAGTSFAMKLMPDQGGNAPDFNAAAAATNLTVHTSALFAVTEPVPGLDVDRDFNRAAFRLDPSDPERAASDAILGMSNAYVLAFSDRKEPRIPGFDEALPTVMPVAVSNAQHEAFSARVGQIRGTIAQRVSTGEVFATAAAESGLNVTTTAPFTVYENLSTSTFAYAESLIPSLMTLRKGEVSEPIEIKEGALLACVADRLPGDGFSVQTLRPELLSTLENYRASICFDNWCDYILAQSDFKDFRPITEGAGPESKEPPEGAEPPSGPDTRGNPGDLL